MVTGMSLTEFLDARITDDEADVTRRRQRYARSVKFDGEDYTERFDTIESIDRAARECEAKRKIIDLAGDHTDSADPIGHLGTMYYTDDYERVLRALALPYADHPDYRKVGMS
jgi:hypothetical protein